MRTTNNSSISDTGNRCSPALLAFLKRSALAVAILLAPSATLHAAEVTNLRCEYRSEALGIDEVKPRLSWVIESDRRDVRQTYYQVLVASTPELLAMNQADLWDSGKVSSNQSNHVEYAGKPLESRMQCHWKVKVGTTAGDAWSKPAFWSMGLLKPEDFTAK